jgi:hypothetical protein
MEIEHVIRLHRRIHALDDSRVHLLRIRERTVAVANDVVARLSTDADYLLLMKFSNKWFIKCREAHPPIRADATRGVIAKRSIRLPPVMFNP